MRRKLRIMRDVFFLQAEEIAGLTFNIMVNAIIILVIALIVFFAIKGSVSHFKGEGACCGGGDGKTKKIRPRKLANVVATKIVRIDGMVCDNCEARVQNALNSIDDISAKVSRSKGQAVVQLGRSMDDDVIERAVTDLGYTVREIVNG